MNIVETTLEVILAITGVLMILLILMHKGRGGGLSDMFGGGISSGAGSSGVAEKNLNRYTIILSSIWAAAVVALNVIGRL